VNVFVDADPRKAFGYYPSAAQLVIPNHSSWNSGETPCPKLFLLTALLAFHARSKGSGPVVRTVEGQRLGGPRYWFERALREAKIEGLHWHDLRHTFASRLVMAGVNLRAVQEALGHKSISMTVRYAHLSPEYQLEAVERLVPKPQETSTVEPTDTTTDTGPTSIRNSEMTYVH
jgi:hypothetical protein